MISSKMKAANYLAIDRISKYKDKDIESLVKILDQHAAEARIEQREMCSKICKTYINAAISTGELDNGIGQYVIDVVLEACLNATGESDERNT